VALYIEDLKYPRRGRRRLPEMSEAEIKEREKVARILKNERARNREANVKDRIEIILRKPEYARTEEENMLVESDKRRKTNKNARSRERTRERKEKMEDILAKPEDERTKEEIEWLEKLVRKKQKKNLQDRIRRLRTKETELKKSKDHQTETESGTEDVEEYPQETQNDSD
jgi:hypothetical protein